LDPEIQLPPWFRQQFIAPSVVIALSPQTTEPPAWLHWLVEVHWPPSGVPPVGALVPPQTPPPHTAAPQQCMSDEQTPPALRQQLNWPSTALPLSLQMTGTPPAGVPAWLHSAFAPNAVQLPPKAIGCCARAPRNAGPPMARLATPAMSPPSTVRRDAPLATARANLSKRCPSISLPLSDHIRVRCGRFDGNVDVDSATSPGQLRSPCWQ
jgi:hypothetical protein